MSAGISELEVTEVFNQLKEGDHAFLDVRSEAEYHEVHAVGTRLIELDRLSPTSIKELDIPKDKRVFIICRSGRRSMVACQLFNSLGYQDMVNVAGGTLAWEASDLPVE